MKPTTPLDLGNIVSIVVGFNLVRPEAWGYLQNYFDNLKPESKTYFKEKLFDCFNRVHGVYLTEYGIPLGEDGYKISYENSTFTITYQDSIVFSC